MFALVTLAAELAAQLIAVEQQGEDAVHQARTRVRRIRSVLSAYRRAFEPEAARDLRWRLRTLGGSLGEARDLDVRAAALENLLAAETAPDVVDPVSAFSADARRDYADAERALWVTLRSPEHRELLADLQSFAANPPLRGRARKHPGELTAVALSKALDRVRCADLSTLEDRHEVRKAARRLRYAAEAADADPTVDLGDRGAELAAVASAAEAVQDALGDSRDLILLAAHLRDRASETPRSASAAAGIARLAAQCEADAEARLVDARHALGTLSTMTFD